MANGDQSTGKGTVAAVIAAVAAILVAVFGNFQNIFKSDDPKGGAVTTTASPRSTQSETRPDIKAESGSVVITNSSAGRDISVNTDKEQKK